MLKSYPKLFNGKQTSFETEILPRKKVGYNTLYKSNRMYMCLSVLKVERT